MSKAKELPIAVEVINGRIVPADVFAEEEIAKLPQRVRFNTYWTVAKSDPDDEHGKLLKLYMAGIPILYDYLPCTGPGTKFPTPDHVRKEILKQIDFADHHPRRDDPVFKVARSMSRDHMTFEELEFCFELSQLYVLAWTEAETGEAFDPWRRWKDLHPMTGRP